eukprot:5576103-Pyramimonas_sp.AAC.1
MEGPRFRGHRLVPMTSFKNRCSLMMAQISQRFSNSSVLQRHTKKISQGVLQALRTEKGMPTGDLVG